MIWDQELDKKDREDFANTESRTMGEFAKMASGIISCLKFTWDIPPDSGGGMPVLDTCCWVGEEERIEGIDPAIVPDKYKHLIITKHSKLLWTSHITGLILISTQTSTSPNKTRT